MECTICSRSAGGKLPFHCPACARHSLYELRVEHARHLLARESSSRKVEDVISREPGPALGGDGQQRRVTSTEIATRWDVYRASMHRQEAELHTREIQVQADTLRKDIEEARMELATLKAAVARRWTDYASVTHNLSSRRRGTLESVDKTTKRTSYRADQQHQKTAESRVFLCREAAKLYGLRQRRRKRGEGMKDEYVIGGLGIVDLKDLNSATPAQISTSFAHVCHLLVLASHYLSLQLPAEITLPHHDHPVPTIYPPSASYVNRPVVTQSSASSSSEPQTPASRRDSNARSHHHSRPRPLSLDRPLPHLARDDPAAHSLFLEGVTLLAWDVAWTCRTQGINIGSQSWDEICSIGKNLWSLLVSPPSSALLSPVTTIRRTPPQPHVRSEGVSSRSESVPRNNEDLNPMTSNAMGYYSHGTAHSFLSSAEGTEFMRGWKLNGPIAKTVDQLKSFLAADMAGLEWEVLENHDVEEQHAIGAATGHSEGVNHEVKKPVNGYKLPSSQMHAGGATGDGGGAASNSDGQTRWVDRRDGTRNEARDENDDDDDDDDQQTRMMLGGGGGVVPSREKTGGTSGWMKLRSRS
ncbi:MAG: hypothetical protein M1823_004015 [Watsoniomyces obsoletus]|nr:MAG: hypothetical protein M1823_004015 [Watsoniomyces obsoletus]